MIKQLSHIYFNGVLNWNWGEISQNGKDTSIYLSLYNNFFYSCPQVKVAVKSQQYESIHTRCSRATLGGYTTAVPPQPLSKKRQNVLSPTQSVAVVLTEKSMAGLPIFRRSARQSTSLHYMAANKNKLNITVWHLKKCFLNKWTERLSEHWHCNLPTALHCTSASAL